MIPMRIDHGLMMRAMSSRTRVTASFVLAKGRAGAREARARMVGEAMRRSCADWANQRRVDVCQSVCQHQHVRLTLFSTITYRRLDIPLR